MIAFFAEYSPACARQCEPCYPCARCGGEQMLRAMSRMRCHQSW